MKLTEILSDDVLQRMRKVILDVGLSKDSCIASSAILIAVLKNLGIKTEPVSVKLQIYNKTFAEWLKANDWKQPTQNEIGMELVNKGARMVGVGFSESELPGAEYHGKASGWAGHLVVGLKPRPDRPGALVDLSADQAHRPKKGIWVVKPLLATVDVETWPQFMTAKTSIFGEDPITGTAFEYYAVPGDASYLGAPDWIDQKRKFKKVVEELTKAIPAFIKALNERNAKAAEPAPAEKPAP